jgi:[CysO sulfur-carrier protein]-S-L-cysteine hydrolase
MINSMVLIGNRVIEIPTEVRDELVRHAVAELPNEACGLLAGPGGQVVRFFAMRNADRSPMTYRLDPKEQIEVFTEIEEKGWDLVAIFHSHTHTPAYPSPTDRAQAFYPDACYLLVSLASPQDPELRGFTIREDEVQELEVRVP